jgi:hypothetical protein
MARSHADSSRAAKLPGGGPPELTTSPSRPPRASTAAWTAAAGPSEVVKSAGTAVPPIRAAIASRSSDARATVATCAPSAATASAIAAPRPRLAPPTMIRLPSSPRSTPPSRLPPSRRLRAVRRRLG